MKKHTVEDAARYELVMGRWSTRLSRPFLDFVGPLDGLSVLDVGCGTGNLTTSILERSNPSVVLGVDLSEAFIDHARARTTDPRCRYEVRDARHLEGIDDGSYDTVLSLLALHFVPRPEQAVHEMRRVAKRGGTVAATVWDARGGFVANRIFFDTAAALDTNAQAWRSKNYTRPYTRPGELGQAWREAGLLDVCETVLHIRMDFRTFGDFWEPYLGGDGPGAAYLATLTADGLERLEQAVRAAYLDGEEDGLRSFNASAWAVSGRAP